MEWCALYINKSFVFSPPYSDQYPFKQDLYIDLDVLNAMERIGDWAEAIIYKDGEKVLKERISKSYRIPEIDTQLRKYRTRREAKLLQKLEKYGFTPKVLSSDDKEMKIEMVFIDGPRLRDVLNKDNFLKYSKEIGEKLAILHNHDVIHSDLTTSNMIYEDKVYFIDFGLSSVSTKIEDKAVDLHLLRQALESKHHDIYERCYEAVLKGYKKSYSGADDVISRLNTVEGRGRNKRKGI